LQVPTLRGLRALEPVAAPDSAPSVARQERRRTPLGCAFTTCLVMAVVGGGASLLFWLVRFGIDTSETIESALAEGNARIDEMPIDHSFDLWKYYTGEGLGEQNPPEFISNLRHAAVLSLLGWITLGMATAGLLGAIGLTWWSIISKNDRPGGT
jgi:hypothetical protein